MTASPLRKRREPVGWCGIEALYIVLSELDASERFDATTKEELVEHLWPQQFVADDSLAHIECDPACGPSRVSCRFVLDCSGRAGVLGKAHRRIESSYRMYAMVGVWCRPGGWPLPDETHTLVETYEDGWAWSVPLSGT